VVTAAGGFGTNFYTVRMLRAYRPGQVLVPAYQFGNIGNCAGMSTGPAAAVKMGVTYQAPYKGSPVVVVNSDAGFGQQCMEIETQTKYRLPVIHIVYSNNAWGTFSSYNRTPSGHMHLFQENLRYNKIAEALGAQGEYVIKPEGFLPALERAWKFATTESTPYVISCQGKKEYWIKDQYPPGFINQISPGVASIFH